MCVTLYSMRRAPRVDGEFSLKADVTLQSQSIGKRGLSTGTIWIWRSKNSWIGMENACLIAINSKEHSFVSLRAFAMRIERGHRAERYRFEVNGVVVRVPSSPHFDSRDLPRTLSKKERVGQPPPRTPHVFTRPWVESQRPSTPHGVPVVTDNVHWVVGRESSTTRACGPHNGHRVTQ